MLGKQFQKMRRRLTVTGASQNIDGVSRLEQTDSMDVKKTKKKEKVKNSQRTYLKQCVETRTYGHISRFFLARVPSELF